VIKAIFFDWFNTLAHYYPPREELESQALKELGFNISPKALSYGLYLGDKHMYEENTRLPIRLRSAAEQNQASNHIPADYSEKKPASLLPMILPSN